MTLNAAFAGWIMLFTVGQSPADQQVRATIERSLPFIQTEGQRWIEEKKCVTCHQVPFMVWALNAAADRGLVLDRPKLAEWSAWATDWKHLATKEDLEKGEQHTLERHHDPVTQLLLGRSTRDRQPAAAWPALFAERLAAGQQDDGSWKAGGQLPAQKRPERETQEVTTMWALVALQSYAAADQPLQSRFAKARTWLGNQAVPQQNMAQSTEWWAAWLLLERGSGNTDQADRIRDQLIKRQHDDGGWGWLSADESDAFGTGVALYSLARDGLVRDGTASDHPALVQASQYLIQTQTANGSWPVKGTKKNKAQQIEPTATYWGTCWAVIGLTETLPRPLSD